MDLRIGKKYRLARPGTEWFIVEIVAIGRFIKTVQIIGDIRCEPKEFDPEVFESIFEPID